MNNDILAVCIAFASIGLFALGWFAGYNSYVHEHNISIGTDNPFRVQWEVLLTGLVAMLGGVMAYRGATEPLRHSQKVEAAAYLSQMAHVEVFLNMTDQSTDYGRQFLSEYANGTIGPIVDVAKLATDGMDGLPQTLATRSNFEIERRAFAGLYAIAFTGEPRPELVKNVRHKVVAFLDMLRRYAS